MISSPYGIIPFDKHCIDIMTEFDIHWIPDDEEIIKTPCKEN